MGCSLQPSPTLIIGMIVSHCSMSDTCFSQILYPTGISTKDIFLIHRRHGICERTFKIHYHSISITEYGRYFLEEIAYTLMLCNMAHTTI